MSQQITVTVDQAAGVKVETSGFVGSGCKAVTSAIEKAIGQTTQDQTKPEFVHQAKQAAGQANQQNAGAGA